MSYIEIWLLGFTITLLLLVLNPFVLVSKSEVCHSLYGKTDIKVEVWGIIVCSILWPLCLIPFLIFLVFDLMDKDTMVINTWSLRKFRKQVPVISKIGDYTVWMKFTKRHVFVRAMRTDIPFYRCLPIADSVTLTPDTDVYTWLCTNDNHIISGPDNDDTRL